VPGPPAREPRRPGNWFQRNEAVLRRRRGHAAGGVRSGDREGMSCLRRAIPGRAGKRDAEPGFSPARDAARRLIACGGQGACGLPPARWHPGSRPGGRARTLRTMASHVPAGSLPPAVRPEGGARRRAIAGGATGGEAPPRRGHPPEPFPGPSGPGSVPGARRLPASCHANNLTLECLIHLLMPIMIAMNRIDQRGGADAVHPVPTNRIRKGMDYRACGGAWRWSVGMEFRIGPETGHGNLLWRRPMDVDYGNRER
jgi:hypothetical protein